VRSLRSRLKRIPEKEKTKKENRRPPKSRRDEPTLVARDDAGKAPRSSVVVAFINDHSLARLWRLSSAPLTTSWTIPIRKRGVGHSAPLARAIIEAVAAFLFDVHVRTHL